MSTMDDAPMRTIINRKLECTGRLLREMAVALINDMLSSLLRNTVSTIWCVMISVDTDLQSE
jgi:hypothetical protein